MQPVEAAAAHVQAIDPVVAVAPPPPGTPAAPGALKTFTIAPIPATHFVRTTAGGRTFAPFPTVDNSNKPTSDDTPIKTPTGATMSAGAYWRQVNAIERQLNAKGESIRDVKIDDGRLLGSTQPELLAHISYKSRGPAKLKLGPNKLAQLAVLGHKRIVFVMKGTGGKKNVAVVAAAPAPTPSPTPPHKIPGAIGPSAPPSFGPVNVPHGNGNMHSPPPTPPGQVAQPLGYGSTAGGGGAPATPNATVCQYAGNQQSAVLAADLLGIALKSAGCAPIAGLTPAGPSGYATTIDLPWSPTPWGDRSTAQLYVNADLALTADPSKQAPIASTATAAVGAYILSAGGDIFSVTTQITGGTASVNLLLFGKSVYSTSSQSILTNTFDDPQTFFNVQVDIPILFFDLILSASAGGDFGINFNFNLGNGSAAFAITPFLNLYGTFSASIGIDIVVASVSVGVYGNLTIANLTLPASLTAGFGLNDTLQGPPSAVPAYGNNGSTTTGTTSNQIIACQLTFNHKLTLDFDYTLLSGNAGVQAQACFLLYCDTAQHQMYAWSGVTGSDNILDDEGNLVDVGPVFTDLPEFGFALAANQQYSPDDENEEPKLCDQFAGLSQ